MDPITMQATPGGEETLLGILQRLRDLSQQPVVPQNPLAQLGTVLQGFAAGVQGQPNPALQMFQQQRQQEVQGLAQQAQIGGALGMMGERKEARAQTLREFSLKLAKDLENSESLEERIQAVRLKQTIVNPSTGETLLPANADPVRLASMRGKEYGQRADQILTLMMNQEDPGAPHWRSLFPPDIFGPQIQRAKLALASGGPQAVNRLREKPESVDSVMKVDALRIEAIPEAQRTLDDRARLGVYQKYLKTDTIGTNTALTLAKALKAKDVAAGVPPRSDASYIEAALKATDRSESFERDLEVEAGLLGLIDQARLDWKHQKRVAYQKTIADVKVGAQPIPAEHATPIAALRDGGRMVATLMSEFTPAERTKYAGWFNFKGRQAVQLVIQDPKFARFKALVARGKNMAFGEGGKQLTPMEASVVFGWVPTGDEISPVDFEEKLKVAWNRVETVLDDRITLATNPRALIKEALKPLPPMTPQGQAFEYRQQPDGSILVVPRGK